MQKSLLLDFSSRSARATSALLTAIGGLLATPSAAHAQINTGTVIVRVTADSTPVAGATIASGTARAMTDRSGLATFTLPTGRRTFRVAPTGFSAESLAVFVGVGTTRVTVAVRPDGQESTHLLPVGPVSAIRGGLRTTDAPTTVDVSDRDMVVEQLERSPGDLSGAFANVSGVRVQPLSAGSGGAALRLRGMPGRYTKILIDGLPLLGATPEGTDLLQLSTLDVQRIEVVKGVSSALYGPTALGGVVNVVSAPPTAQSQAVVNGSSLEGSDAAVWQTHTFTPQWSASLLAGRHYQNPSDPDGDGWAEVSGYKRIAVRPRVYWARSDKSSWFMTGGWTSENRRSGTVDGARLPDFRTYSADADTRRADAGTVGRIVLDSNSLLTIRASLTREWRDRWYGEDLEGNRRSTIFGDVALTKSLGANTVVTGVAIERDQYTAFDTREHSYRYTTPALYAEHTWTYDRWFGITSGARLDLHSEYGDFVSPRVSVLLRPSDEWQVRVSRAVGVYAPTPLTDETEAVGLSHVRATARQAEHADGWSLDATRTKGAVELRGSAYRTVVAHPLVLRTRFEDQQELVNADEPMRMQGADFSLRYRTRPLNFTASYSYIDATRPVIGQLFGDDFEVDTTMRRAMPMTPRHVFDVDLTHQRENDRTIGLAAHFVGRQELTDTLLTHGDPYVTLDARIEKHVRRAILFGRAKNITGVHQGQFNPVLRRASGQSGEWTNDVWAPLDGRVFSLGVRVEY